LSCGASYSTSEGAGGDARWTRYNTFRRGTPPRYSAGASTIDSRLGVDVSLPHWQRARQTLKGSTFVYQQLTSAYQETGVGVSLDMERKFDRTSFITLGASVDYSRTREVSAGTLAKLGRSRNRCGSARGYGPRSVR